MSFAITEAKVNVFMHVSNIITQSIYISIIITQVLKIMT